MNESGRMLERASGKVSFCLMAGGGVGVGGCMDV